MTSCINWIKRADRSWQIDCLAHTEKVFAGGVRDYLVAATSPPGKTLLSCDLMRQGWI